MNKIYQVRNSRNHKGFILAPSVEIARLIGYHYKWANSTYNLYCKDCTDILFTFEIKLYNGEAYFISEHQYNSFINGGYGVIYSNKTPLVNQSYSKANNFYCVLFPFELSYQLQLIIDYGNNLRTSNFQNSNGFRIHGGKLYEYD